MIKITEAKDESQGIFWLIDNKIYAFPFVNDSNYINGIAKSGNTYNHKLLWNDVRPRGCNKPFDYYPRGRVVISKNGKITVYMNPNISDEYIKDIKTAFGLRSEPIINYDYSDHYKCHLD